MASLPRSVVRRARSMAAMMRHLGIWPDRSFTDLPMESAIGTCLSCREAGRCGRWLADPDSDPEAWQRFCPNAELFARLRGGSIDELLDDPLVQFVMASDGVRREDLERLMGVCGRADRGISVSRGRRPLDPWTDPAGCAESHSRHPYG